MAQWHSVDIVSRQRFQELSTVGITEEDADLDIPMFIAEHDMSLHGIRYYNPWAQSRWRYVPVSKPNMSEVEMSNSYWKV
jgi:hypothetical protein